MTGSSYLGSQHCLGKIQYEVIRSVDDKDRKFLHSGYSALSQDGPWSPSYPPAPMKSDHATSLAQRAIRIVLAGLGI